MANSTAPITSPSDTSKAAATTTLPPTESSTTPTTESIATTSTATAPISSPQSTQLITSVITASNDGTSQSLQTVVITQGNTFAQTTGPSNTGTSPSTSSSTAVIPVGQNKGSSNGLSAGGKTAIAVVIPVVAVALLIIAGLFLWRKRNQRQSEKEERKKEMEEYGYNPNHDPTLPAVAATDEIVEDQSGYRGWGVASNSNRKASTTISGGMTHLSDGGYPSPGSPTQGASVSDQNSGDPLMNQRHELMDSVSQRHELMDSEIIGNLAAAPAAAAATTNTGVRRGPSNASSAYSAGDHSANSEARAAGPNGQQDYYADNTYYQPGPYENPYGGGQQPVIRDNPARRNTRIERPDVFPHQGTSGIAQNF